MLQCIKCQWKQISITTHQLPYSHNHLLDKMILVFPFEFYMFDKHCFANMLHKTRRYIKVYNQQLFIRFICFKAAYKIHLFDMEKCFTHFYFVIMKMVCIAPFPLHKTKNRKFFHIINTSTKLLKVYLIYGVCSVVQVYCVQSQCSKCHIEMKATCQQHVKYW